jgi:hypothetical protein
MKGQFRALLTPSSAVWRLTFGQARQTDVDAPGHRRVTVVGLGTARTNITGCLSLPILTTIREQVTS